MSMVHDAFPNAPSACRDCPGLGAAAVRVMAASRGVAKMTVEVSESGVSGSVQAADVIFTITTERLAGVQAAAAQLYEQCPRGSRHVSAAVIDRNPSGQSLRRVVGVIACGSDHPTAWLTTAERADES